MSRKKKKEEKREQLAIKDFFDRILPGVLKFYSDHYICGDSYRCVWAIKEYVGMVAAQYSQVSGKEFDVRYSVSHGEHGARLHLHETSLVQRTAEPGDEFPQKGSCRQLYENSPLFEMLQRSQTEDETPEENQEDSPCLRL